MENNKEGSLKKRMTGRSYKQWLKRRAQLRFKHSEDAAKKEDQSTEEQEHKVEEVNAHRVDDRREKQICSSKENDKKVTEPFKAELKVDRTHDANCVRSKQDDKSVGESKDCSICKQKGNLLCCAGRGCKRNFHLSCLVPPVSYFPPGAWHCYWCVRRKMKLGVHAISEGIESLLDVRKLSLANEVVQKREYLVKYKGLAHVHNLWITEEQLRLEAPAALARFKKYNKSVSWKTEWSVPHRLLDKRKLAVIDHNNTDVHGNDENDADCHYEWLVKWTGLDYSHATWELENASFLMSLEAVKLMTDYEIRHQQAKKEVHPLTEDEKRKANFTELPTPLFGSAPQVYNNHLSIINNLRKYWQKGQSAVIIDDQERILKVVLFLLSLPKDVGLPFLIITTSAALLLWEAEFSHWGYANIVVYKGNRDLRAIIRTLEFYNKQGALMFQVLLSCYDAIVEDLEMLRPIGWGAVIIDQCQGSSMSMHHSRIKVLIADMRLLIFRQLEDRRDRRFNRCNILSFLDPNDKANNKLLDTDSDIDLTEFKERLKHFVAYECKSSASKFIEYWVPVKLSNEQIEQYCACLFSNSAWLCSSLKNDSPSCLCDILVSTRKCCDHPYLENQSLRDVVMDGIPVDQHFDAEIKLSGKLELLNKILQEIKQQGQRVLVLFRSLGGSGVISIGDILDDFIYRKFGGDSYTSISGNVTRKMKEATLNKFNNKGSGKFAVLMETRACVPSVKLLGIDIIILFNSDWDPNNDLRSLQKITVYSQSEHIKVLRLYSCFTVEEKALILAKQGLTIDSNIENMKQAACHELLTWGASYLFSMLDCFHVQSSVSKISSEVAALDEVFAECLGLMSSNCENSVNNSGSKILKIQQNGGTYPSKISLLGELKMQQMDDSSFVRRLLENESPHVFWTNLLHGRVPMWKHSPSPSRGNRRKVRLQGDVNQPSKGEQVSKKEGNKVHLTPEPKLRKKRKLHVQGKLGTSHLSAGDKHKCRRLATNRSPQCDKPHQSHENCINSSRHQILDSMNRSIDSSIQQSIGNLPLQRHARIGAVNGTSMKSRNNHEDDASPNTPNRPQSPYLHPLHMEMERIQKEREQITKLHEDVKLLLQSEFEKELDSIMKKYDLLLQIAEMELSQKHEDLDTVYKKVHVHKLLAEAMTQIQDTADSVGPLEMTADVVGSTITGSEESLPNRPSSVPAVTASNAEPVNSEQRAADPQIYSENFLMAAIPSLNAELPRVEELAVVRRTSARATLQTTSSADLPTSGSRPTPTPNYQSVILTPNQLPIQTSRYAARPGAGCEQRRPAPHLLHFRPLPTMNSLNSSLL
ncbi:protein CHROMATIN REMODELING 4-like [Solanum pennellii]|uniref:Protein CHROMATIN REMODELING 4-like n=1 Tax=Solanum pennellii TaxID=28526 RepID=A0ABM1HSC8_SOLPN|nr:protein CHROMATIN REMODELING 4-like [Solanum pennellii]